MKGHNPFVALEKRRKFVRRLWFSVALSAVLMGTLASTANSQTSAPSQSPIPAAITKDCEARILKDSPRAKFVGPFSRLSYKSTLMRWGAEGKILLIAAPTRAPGFMDRIVKHSMGCKYYIRDGKPVFDQLIPEIDLPRRRLMPGEE